MVSQDRLTRTYDECSKRPVFGDCAKSNGFSLERPKNRLQHLRPDGPHDAQGHQKADPSAVRMEASARAQSSRFFEDGYSRHGRLDGDGLLMEWHLEKGCDRSISGQQDLPTTELRSLSDE